MNDVCYVDTFFSSIQSARYSCWNLVSYKRTALDDIYLTRRRAQSPSTLTRLVSECDAPTTIKSDNAPEFKSKRWVLFLETMSIRSEFTEAHHPNKNLGKRCGGNIKATVHLLRITRCPLELWCYLLEHVCSLLTILARHSLDWSTLYKLHWGKRPDISMFHFIFWEPIRYLNP